MNAARAPEPPWLKMRLREIEPAKRPLALVTAEEFETMEHENEEFVGTETTEQVAPSPMKFCPINVTMLPEYAIAGYTPNKIGEGNT